MSYLETAHPNIREGAIFHISAKYELVQNLNLKTAQGKYHRVQTICHSHRRLQWHIPSMRLETN